VRLVASTDVCPGPHGWQRRQHVKGSGAVALVAGNAAAVPQGRPRGLSQRYTWLSSYLPLPSTSLRATRRSGPARRARGFVAICGIRVQITIGGMIPCGRLLINLDVSADAGRAAHGPVLPPGRWRSSPHPTAASGLPPKQAQAASPSRISLRIATEISGYSVNPSPVLRTPRAAFPQGRLAGWARPGRPARYLLGGRPRRILPQPPGYLATCCPRRLRWGQRPQPPREVGLAARSNLGACIHTRH